MPVSHSDREYIKRVLGEKALPPPERTKPARKATGITNSRVWLNATSWITQAFTFVARFVLLAITWTLGLVRWTLSKSFAAMFRAVSLPFACALNLLIPSATILLYLVFVWMIVSVWRPDSFVAWMLRRVFEAVGHVSLCTLAAAKTAAVQYAHSTWTKVQQCDLFDYNCHLASLTCSVMR